MDFKIDREILILPELSCQLHSVDLLCNLNLCGFLELLLFSRHSPFYAGILLES